MRKLWLALVAVVVLSCGLVYHVSDTVAAEQKRLGQVRAEIQRAHEALSVLRAEWAYLTEPSRLQELAKTHLNLTPLDITQVHNAPLNPVAKTAMLFQGDEPLPAPGRGRSGDAPSTFAMVALAVMPGR